MAIALSQVVSDIHLILSAVTAPQHTKIVVPRNVTTRSQRQNSGEAHRKASQDLNTRLAAIGCLFPCLLNAVNQLTEDVQEAVAQPRIIHDIIRILRDLLECLLVLAANDNKNLPYADYQRRWKPQSKATFPPLDGTVMKFCQLLLRLVTSVDLRRATDQKIWDGFLYFLLDHVGTILRLFVFGPDSSEIPSPNHEGQALKGTPITYDEEKRIAEVQAPYLVYILARIIPLAEEHRKYTVRHAVKAPRLSISTPKGARLSHPAFATLQSTLLASVFGPKSSTEFVDGLAFPLPNDQDADAGSGFESGATRLDTADCVADWFKAEVWRVLGWEVLSGKIAWDE